MKGTNQRSALLCSSLLSADWGLKCLIRSGTFLPLHIPSEWLSSYLVNVSSSFSPWSLCKAQDALPPDPCILAPAHHPGISLKPTHQKEKSDCAPPHLQAMRRKEKGQFFILRSESCFFTCPQTLACWSLLPYQRSAWDRRESALFSADISTWCLAQHKGPIYIC